ncbi:TPA: hypothetical protein ACI4FD_003817, partial [Klebsiella aerogenes]
SGRKVPKRFLVRQCNLQICYRILFYCFFYRAYRKTYNAKKEKTLFLISKIGPPCRFAARRCARSCFFVQKFNSCLFFSTLICCLNEITNIISMIRQQAPENGVMKITVMTGERQYGEIE